MRKFLVFCISLVALFSSNFSNAGFCRKGQIKREAIQARRIASKKALRDAQYYSKFVNILKKRTIIVKKRMINYLCMKRRQQILIFKVIMTNQKV